MILSALLAAGLALASAPTLPDALPPPSHTADWFRCWHDVAYGPRGDLPDEGDGFKGKKGGWRSDMLPWKFHRHRSGQFLDVYAPHGELATNATVVLCLHGGSWCEIYDKDMPPCDLFRDLLSRGAVACTADYILQNEITFFAKKSRTEATFAQMMRDVDAAVTRIKAFVSALGVTAPRFAITGESAGGHLAMLYAYDQGNPDWMGLGLSHEMRIAKAVDIVGPVDFASEDFARLGTIRFLGMKFRIRPLWRHMNRLAGIADDASYEESAEALKKWSPRHLVCAGSAPTALAYGAVGKDGATDGVVPVEQFTALEAALKEAGVPCASKRFDGARHEQVTWKGAKWIADQLLSDP